MIGYISEDKWSYIDAEVGEEQKREIVEIFKRYGYELNKEQKMVVHMAIELFHSFAHTTKMRAELGLIIKLYDKNNHIEVGGEFLGAYEDDVRNAMIDGLFKKYIEPYFQGFECSLEFVEELYQMHSLMNNGYRVNSKIKMHCIMGLRSILPNPQPQKPFYECLYDVLEYLDPNIWGSEDKVKRRYTDKQKVVAGVMRNIEKYLTETERSFNSPEAQASLKEHLELIESRGEMTEEMIEEEIKRLYGD